MTSSGSPRCWLLIPAFFSLGNKRKTQSRVCKKRSWEAWEYGLGCVGKGEAKGTHLAGAHSFTHSLICAFTYEHTEQMRTVFGVGNSESEGKPSLHSPLMRPESWREQTDWPAFSAYTLPLAVAPHPPLSLSEHMVFASVLGTICMWPRLHQSPVRVANISWVPQQIRTTPNRTKSKRSSLNQVHKDMLSAHPISRRLAEKLPDRLHPVTLYSEFSSSSPVLTFLAPLLMPSSSLGWPTWNHCLPGLPAFLAPLPPASALH